MASGGARPPRRTRSKAITCTATGGAPSRPADSRTLVGWPWPKGDPRTGGERTDLGWEIYPEGLYHVLRRVGRYGKPVIITENGIADADDDQRAAYIVAHLRQAHRAISDGVDLRGYMHWSLMDNF